VRFAPEHETNEQRVNGIPAALTLPDLVVLSDFRRDWSTP
jgi:hypothetical protein